MLLGKGFESGGHMAAMGKLLASGNSLELSAAEEIARERVAMMAVQKEMSEADEANLLEEEDMHVFDQEPLSDRFSLVSCNTCKKPIKVSQYAAHAERCRSLMMSDDSHEVDGGNGHKKLPRKSRNGLLGEADVSLSDEAAVADSGVSATDVQMLGGFSNSKAGKRTMNGAEVNTGPKVGRPRKIAVSNHKESTSMTDGIVEDCMGAGPSTVVQSEGVSSAAKRRKPFLPFTAEDLDVMCGVPSPRSGAPCRQPLTCKSHSISSKRAVVGRRKPFDALLQELKDNIAKKAQQAEIPRPIATKVYCSRHHQQMRAVINNLYLGRSGSNESGALAPQQPGAGVVPVDPDPQQQQQQKSQHMLMSLNKGLQ